MEIYDNKDKSVTKYLHNDGSETCIKVVPSQQYTLKDDKLILQKKEREKYSVLISHSCGCPIKCKMCYLTIKKYPYYKLSYIQILHNVKNAIRSKVKENPSLKNKYIKFCWMGMGDAFLDLEKVFIVTTNLVEWALVTGQAKGLDGVDIGTVFPKNTKNLYLLNNLNQYLSHWDDNPYNPKRSPLRIFYSLHDTLDRHRLIPSGNFYRNICQTLQEFKNLCNIDVIFHYVFLNNINDSDVHIQSLKRLFERIGYNHELRVLRYNECKDSPYKESSKFEEICKKLSTSVPKIKFQISPGSEIKAACGQFLLGRYNEKENTLNK